MKAHILQLVLTLFTFTAFAQPFEGIISYKIAYQVVDEARTDLEIYKNMIPDRMNLSIKGPSSMLKFTGGMTQGILGDILYKTNEKAIYSLFHSTKTYTKTSVQNLISESDKSLKAIKSDSLKIISGYECNQYIIKDEKENTETSIWCAADIKNPSSRIMTFFLQSMTNIGVSGVEGLPLIIAFKGSEFKLLLTADSVDKKGLDAMEFTLPKSYKLSKNDPALE